MSDGEVILPIAIYMHPIGTEATLVFNTEMKPIVFIVLMKSTIKPKTMGILSIGCHKKGPSISTRVAFEV